MDRNSFISWLRAAGLSSAGCASRCSWAARIERDFDVDLDFVVQDDDVTLDLIEQIYDAPNLTERQHANFPNAVRKYYEYVNHKSLGTLRQNGRR